MWQENQENQEEQAAVEHITSMKEDQGANSGILHYWTRYEHYITGDSTECLQFLRNKKPA